MGDGRILDRPSIDQHILGRARSARVERLDGESFQANARSMTVHFHRLLNISPTIDL
jgi:hypothetical protein